MVGVIITNNGTHHPSNWADHALEQFVPLPPGASGDIVNMVVQARSELRGPVVDALTAIRNHEVKRLQEITPGDLEALNVAIDERHGFGKGHPEEHGKINAMRMHEWTKVGLRHAHDHADEHVQNIARVAKTCPGQKVGHNEMVDYIYRVLSDYAGSIQWAERSHRATSTRATG